MTKSVVRRSVLAWCCPDYRIIHQSCTESAADGVNDILYFTAVVAVVLFFH